MNDGTGSFWNTLQTSEAVVIKMCGKLEKFFMINDLGKKAGPNTGRVLLFHQGWEREDTSPVLRRLSVERDRLVLIKRPVHQKANHL